MRFLAVFPDDTHAQDGSHREHQGRTGNQRREVSDVVVVSGRFGGAVIGRARARGS